MNFNRHSYSWVGFLALFFIILSVVVNGLGYVYGWGLNGVCSPYLGCVDGFFGYDALEHFVSGIGILFILVWLCRRYPKYSVLHEERWKTIVVLLTSAAFVALMWEFAECAHDAFRLDILREPLLNVRLHLNFLDQPTNIDTMGDFFFGMLGTIAALIFI
jgi:uncharacterized membrane protein YjdF